jgi:hypothetical protein
VGCRSPGPSSTNTQESKPKKGDNKPMSTPTHVVLEEITRRGRAFRGTSKDYPQEYLIAGKEGIPDHCIVTRVGSGDLHHYTTWFAACRDNPNLQWMDWNPTDNEQSFCPICGEKTKIDYQTTPNGRLVGSCGDAFTIAQWGGAQ